MKAEILFPELCNLFAEEQNMKLMRLSAPDIEFIETDNLSTPAFAYGDVSFIYLGSLSESKQRMACERLRPYRERLTELIKGGTVMLFTGNAYEILGKTVSYDGDTFDSLGIYGFDTVCDTSRRHNSHYLGDFDGIKIVGNKSQFSFTYGEFPPAFSETLGGVGRNPDTKAEGIHDCNLFGTHLLGPFLVNNPPFLKYLLRLMGHGDALAFEDALSDAYAKRLDELSSPDARFIMGEHG